MGLYEIIIAFFKKRICYSLIEVLGLFFFFLVVLGITK